MEKVGPEKASLPPRSSEWWNYSYQENQSGSRCLCLPTLHAPVPVGSAGEALLNSQFRLALQFCLCRREHPSDFFPAIALKKPEAEAEKGVWDDQPCCSPLSRALRELQGRWAGCLCGFWNMMDREPDGNGRLRRKERGWPMTEKCFVVVYRLKIN